MSALQDFIQTCNLLSGSPGTCHSRFISAEACLVLKAMLESTLPGEQPGVLSPKAILSLIEHRFSSESYSTAVQRALLLFNDAASFSRIPAPVLVDERLALEAFPSNTSESMEKKMKLKQAQDQRLLAFFRKKQGGEIRPFLEMEAAARKEYFWLWSQSGFGLKRRFCRSCGSAIDALAHMASEPGWIRPAGLPGPGSSNRYASPTPAPLPRSGTLR